MQTTPSPADLDRRNFMKTSLLVGGGIMLGAPALLRAQTPKADALQVAIVGMGAQGRVLTEAMLGIPGLNFRAVCDIWPFSRTYGQNRFGKAGFWWMHAMAGLWSLFVLILFVVEPLVVHRHFHRWATARPGVAFAWLHRVHWVLLMLGLVTILSAVAGSRGWYAL